MQKIIVDGYNVIHSDEELLRKFRITMSRGRDALVERLRAYILTRKIQLTLVFDGAGGMTDGEPIIPGSLQVLYTAAGQTADDLIVATVEEHPSPKAFIVVTSDMADIGRRVRAAGATIMSSQVFLDRISVEPAAGSTASPDKLDSEEVDVAYWLKQFEAPRKDEDEG